MGDQRGRVKGKVDVEILGRCANGGRAVLSWRVEIRNVLRFLHFLLMTKDSDIQYAHEGEKLRPCST